MLQADVSREADIASLAESLRQRFGRVDAWINNAGADILTGAGGRLSRMEKLDLVLAVDLRGTILASWAAVAMMRQQPAGGVIINMSWDHVGLGMEGENPILYSAAKGGIFSFSKSLAREVAPHIRVNILAPGFIETRSARGPTTAGGVRWSRAHAAQALGRTRGPGRRGGFPGLGRVVVRDRAGAGGQRGCGVGTGVGIERAELSAQ